MPWITLVITFGAAGQWRKPGGTWQLFPQAALRGHGGRWTEGCDDPVGSIEYLTAIIEPLFCKSVCTVPAAELEGRFVAVADLPSLARRLKLDRLAACETPESKLEAVAAALLSENETNFGEGLAGRTSKALSQGKRISQVAIELGYSERMFRKRFGDAFGISPKGWQRLSRFAASLEKLHSGFAETRLEGDDAFFDQSHFIHDFRSLSGITPGEYARQKADGDSRLFLAD